MATIGELHSEGWLAANVPGWNRLQDMYHKTNVVAAYNKFVGPYSFPGPVMYLPTAQNLWQQIYLKADEPVPAGGVEAFEKTGSTLTAQDYAALVAGSKIYARTAQGWMETTYSLQYRPGMSMQQLQNLFSGAIADANSNVLGLPDPIVVAAIAAVAIGGAFLSGAATLGGSTAGIAYGGPAIAAVTAVPVAAVETATLAATAAIAAPATVTTTSLSLVAGTAEYQAAIMAAAGGTGEITTLAATYAAATQAAGLAATGNIAADMALAAAVQGGTLTIAEATALGATYGAGTLTSAEIVAAAESTLGYTGNMINYAGAVSLSDAASTVSSLPSGASGGSGGIVQSSTLGGAVASVGKIAGTIGATALSAKVQQALTQAKSAQVAKLPASTIQNQQAQQSFFNNPLVLGGIVLGGLFLMG